MAIGKGLGTYVGIGEESSWGTPVASDDYLKILSESMGDTIETTFEETLDTRSTQYYTDGPKSASGSIEALLGYQGYELLLKHALGAVSTGTVNADGQYTHTFTASNVLPTGLTVTIPKASTQMSGSAQFAGCKISKLTISNAVGEMARIVAEFMGKTVAIVSNESPTYPTFKGAKWNQVSTFTINGTARKAQNITVDISNPLEMVNALGTTTEGVELIETGNREVTAQVTALVEDATLYDLFANRTEFACVFTWRGELIAGSSYYEISVSLPKCIATGEMPKVSSKGVVPITIPIRAIVNSAVNDEITITVKNTKSAV